MDNELNETVDQTLEERVVDLEHKLSIHQSVLEKLTKLFESYINHVTTQFSSIEEDFDDMADDIIYVLNLTVSHGQEIDEITNMFSDAPIVEDEDSDLMKNINAQFKGIFGIN